MFLHGERVGLLPLVLTVALTALPLGYFALLVHFDSVWQRERQVALSTYPLPHVARAFAPLALPALLAYRRRPPSFHRVDSSCLAVCRFGGLCILRVEG